ncbi:MAG TPA: PqqD family protein [Pyrinomonadaceae bacterium]|jgi:hypothetical protein|nr:PqqD family protein [Pyrinomonadaceae bacterium]
MRIKTTPRARKEGLLVQELPNEVLVYDLERHKAHCLNPTAALIWKHCDGRTTVSDMVRLLENSLETSVDEDVVWCALNQLEKDHLLGDKVAWPVGMEPISRRTLIRRVGMAAVLLPLITTIAAPTAQAGTSNCVPQGGACSAATLPCCGALSCIGGACG